LNSVAYIPFGLLHAAANPVTGKVNANFTATAYLASAPATTATPTVTEVGSGRYVLSVTPAATGIWHLAWSVDVDGENVRYEDVLDVATAQQANPVHYLSGQTNEVVSPVAESGTVTVSQGDDYDSAEAQALPWNLEGKSDLTGAVVTLTIASRSVTITQAGTISNPAAATQTVTVELTAAQTAQPYPGTGRYDLAAVLANGHALTLARGVTVTKDMS
jgi:hypothetical protein